MCYAGYLHISFDINCNASVLTARHFCHCALLNRNKSVARQFPANQAKVARNKANLDFVTCFFSPYGLTDSD